MVMESLVFLTLLLVLLLVTGMILLAWRLFWVHPAGLQNPAIPAASVTREAQGSPIEPLVLPLGSKMRQVPASVSTSETSAFQDVLHGLAEIPPLPQTVHKLVRELDSEHAQAHSVSRIISQDPPLAASLLRLVNSPAYGLTRQMISLEEAVSYLGFSTVKSLALRISMGTLLSGNSQVGYSVEKLLQHSMTVSLISESLARRVGRVDPMMASTLGLLHDIGKLAINTQFSAKVAKLWDASMVESGESFLGREERLFGADHAALGAYMASRWQLPDDLVEVIRLHHAPLSPRAMQLRPDLQRALYVVHVANQLAKYHFVYCEDMEIDIISEPVLNSLGLPCDLDHILDERLRKSIAQSLPRPQKSPTKTGA